ncbi:MAG: FAD-dependent oxidoreductase [Chthoniobacterales bacterium]|nr:FAD-dependent oxidoreductase [Chthoniobacterales bacterium]
MLDRFQTHKITCDILVAGGGLSGVCCALSAARAGAKVVLCQDRPVLGGNASSEIRMHIIGANWNRPGVSLELEARESGIIEEIRLENAFRNPQRSPSMFDLILYEKCLAEPSLTLLLNTRILSADVENARISKVTALRTSTEDQFEIAAKVFVDCTGDGGLGVAAGAEYVRGREEQSHFGEPSAVETADGKTLGSSLLFMAKKHNVPMRFLPPPWARKFTAADFFDRECVGPADSPGWEYGFWWLSWGGHLDTIRDNETIRHELLAILLGIWDFIKNGGDHGADHWALEWFGAVPGKRESRRFVGQYVLTEQDLMESREFPDAISYGGWSMELQPPEGFDAKGIKPVRHREMPYLYDIPLRSCLSRNISNLMFAGRNMSASHVAFSSTRVMATCAVTGEGVGLAAALAVRKSVPPAEIPGNTTWVGELRAGLARQDAFVIGAVDLQSDNLAAHAAVRASSERPDGPAAHVLSGQNRCVAHPRGVRAHRVSPGTHRWMSEPCLPAWLEFTWTTPQTINRIEFVFDSGLHRRLTMSHCEAIASQMTWGTGQPEMVRAFSLAQQDEAGEWHAVWQESLWWQRRWARDFPEPLRTRALRITIHETWGCDHARIISARMA